MKRQIIILGAAYFAREVYSMLMDCIASGKEWEFKGFLDNRINLLDDFPHIGAMLGAVEDYEPKEDEYVIPALGDSLIREKYVKLLKSKGAKFETIIHPLASIGANVKIGEGCVVMQFVVITADAEIGNYVNLGVRSTVSHGNKIADYVTMSSQSCLAGEVKVGQGVFMGTNVSVVPHIEVGAGSYLCAGAVVCKDVRPLMRVMGNPAREIGVVGTV